MTEEVEDVKKEQQKGKHHDGASDMERVTDYAEEKEIAGDSGNLDNAMSAIADRRQKDAESRNAREKLLASIKVKKEDVDLIVNEFEVPKLKAERVLKEQNADLVAALKYLLNN
jgi:NACalpha-BTF3-like transcription factor